MSNLSIQEIHHYCINITQEIILILGWRSISVDILSAEDKSLLAAGVADSSLNWSWGMRHYYGGISNGILDIHLKLTDRSTPGSLHAVILCKYDTRRNEFAICMLENFIAHEVSMLTGNILTIALIYSTTFCDMLGLSEVFICDPVPDAQPRYRTYGFAQVANGYNKMSAEVIDIKETIRRRTLNAQDIAY